MATSKVQRIFSQSRIWDPRIAGLVIFLVALALRVVVIYLQKSYTLGIRSPGELENIAFSLAQGGGFANAYGPGTGPTAHGAPLYPILLSLIFRLFGAGVSGKFVEQVLSATLASVQYALLPLVAVACRFPSQVGIGAGLFAALVPLDFWIQTNGSWEYSLSALLAVLVSLAILKTWRDGDFSCRRGLAIGILGGLNLLTTPQLLFTLVVALAYPYATSAEVRKSGYRVFAVTQVAVIAIMLAPWVVRNYLVLGSPIWSRSNLGLELNLSNNDGVSPLWRENHRADVFQKLNPSSNPIERQRISALGEVAYNKEKLAVAKQWMISHPGRLVTLTAQRIWYFWFPPMNTPGQTTGLALATLLGFLGLGLALRRAGHAPRYFLLLWCVFPLPLYLFQQSTRLRYPIEWATFLMAAYALVCLGSKRLRVRSELGGHPANGQVSELGI
jgi:hypothetical protein